MSNWFATRMVIFKMRSTDAFSGTKVTLKGSHFAVSCTIIFIMLGNDQMPSWEYSHVRLKGEDTSW